MSVGSLDVEELVFALVRSKYLTSSIQVHSQKMNGTCSLTSHKYEGFHVKYLHDIQNQSYSPKAGNLRYLIHTRVFTHDVKHTHCEPTIHHNPLRIYVCGLKNSVVNYSKAFTFPYVTFTTSSRYYIRT